MRLGFHYHVPAVSKPDGIYMPGYQGCFVDSLAQVCESVLCFLHMPRLDELSAMDYRITSPNVRLIGIGAHGTILERTFFSRQSTALMRSQASEMDVLLVRGPSPLLPSMGSASPVPTVLLLVGDYVAGVNDLPQPCWRKEAIRWWSYWNRWGQSRVAKRSLTFVNSRILYDDLKGKLSNLHELRTTTLTDKDFFVRKDTCQSKPYSLLYVGRMSRAKGLLQMVEAVKLLTECGEQVTLDLVGWPERGDSILDEIRVLAKTKNIDNKVHYLGSRPLGPELFACYKQADIFMTASYSEGFPRTIWEAMANSLPVIATRVGSIPAFIEGAAELVQPRQAEELAAAVSKLIHHPEVRQNYIIRGLELARRNTLETQSGLMIDKMKDWLREQHA